MPATFVGHSMYGSNVPTSHLDLLTDLYEVVFHPVDEDELS